MESAPQPIKVKLGTPTPTSSVFVSKKMELQKTIGIEFHHYKISSIKLFSTSYIIGIEIQYQCLYKIPEKNYEEFFVDIFESHQKNLKEAKITTYNFGQDEEIVEISGRSGVYLDQLVFKTNRGKRFSAGGEGGSEFCHKAPLGYCFNLIKTCTCKEYIDSLDVDIDLSAAFRYKIYKEIEEKAKDLKYNDYNEVNKNIEVEEDLFRDRYDFEKEENSDLYSYKSMRKDLKEIAEIDKLGFMRYYLKYLYLDRKNSSELTHFPEDLLKTLKDIYKLLKHPKLLFNEKLDVFTHKEIKPIQKTHPAFMSIFQLLIIVQYLLEFPFTPNFTYLKKLLWNIHDIYISFLLNLINLSKEQNLEPEKTIEKIQNLLKPSINLYGHHLGFYVVSENMAKSFLDTSKNDFKLNQLSFKRINSQDIFFYERQMLVHCFQRKVFSLASIPSTLIGIRQFRTNNSEKPNESFFIVTFEPYSLVDIKPLEDMSNEEIATIEDISFSKQLIASIFSSPLESLSASFICNFKTKELIRVPIWNDHHRENKGSMQEDSSLRNPLYVIDIPLVLKPLNKEISQKLRDLPLEKLFVEFLAWIKLETFLISFEYFQKNENSFEMKKNEKMPIFSMSEETIKFLFRSAINNLAFIKDNSHLKLVEILFHLNPIVSLCQEQLLRYFPDHHIRLKQIHRFDFDVIFSRSRMDIKKTCRPKIRNYTEKMKKYNNIKGNLPIYRTVTEYLKKFPLYKMEKPLIERFLQEMLTFLPFSNNQEIYSNWNEFMDWEPLIPYLFKNPLIMEFLLDLKVHIKSFKFSHESNFTNLFDLLTNEHENQINDPYILEVYITKAGFNPDEGYPFILTPFERAISKESHILVKKMLILGAGKKANPDNLQAYVLKFYDHDDYELLASETVKESIKFNIEGLLEMHPVLKSRLVWELMKKKPMSEDMKGYMIFVSCENEEIFLENEKIVKKEENTKNFIYNFSHKHLFFDLFFDNEARFHGLHLGITSLMIRLFGSQACVIPTKFVKDSENHCYEVKEFYAETKKVFNKSENAYNSLSNMNFEDICERIVMNIVLLPGEIKPEDELILPKNDGTFRLVPWDFAKHFFNYYISEEAKFQRDFIKSISYLFCLDEMNRPISSELLARIISIDLYKILDEWLHDLSNLHWKLGNIRNIVQNTLKKEEDYLGVMLKQNMISFMVFRFFKLQNMLLLNKNITLNEIFKNLDPDIYEMYEFIKGDNYIDRYKSLLEMGSHKIEDFKYIDYGIYLQIKSRISREIMSVFKNEEPIGPEEALLELKMIREGFVKEKILNNLLEFDKIQYFDLILFALRSFDFKETSPELQEKWINEGLIRAFEKQLNSYNEKAMSLKLKNMNYLTVNALEKMHLLKQIRCLILQGCSLSDEIILLLASECPLLESLDLSYNQSLKNFEGNVKYFKFFQNLTQRPAVFFQSLKHLNLKACENLIAVNVQADLETICLQDCKKLSAFRNETISFNHSLEYADFQGVSSFPEKEMLKILSNQSYEIKLDDKTCKGIFMNILKEFPNYPTIGKSRIPGKLLDFVFQVMERPENHHLFDCFSVKEMTDVELAKLCIEINKNLNSRNLTIKHVDISNNKAIVFAANIHTMKSVISGGFPSVEILDLSQINLGNTIFLKLFAEWLKTNKVMKKLILNDISVKNEDIGIILDAIGKKNSFVLECLSLRKNGFNSIGFHAIATFLEGNNTLKHLDLSYNNFDAKSIKILFKSLNSNKTLLSLTLKSLNIKKIDSLIKIKDVINDEMVDDIVDSLQINKTLKEIDIRNNPISAIKAEVLLNTLQKSSNLKEIRLKSTLFENEINLKKLSSNSAKFQEEHDNIQYNQTNFYHSFLNQSTIRTNSYCLDKSQRNVLPDTWVFGLGIDGGGMRGIIPALLIESLAKHTKCDIHQMFDYIGGSSIGGILALGCAGTLDGNRPICIAEECVNIFTTYGKDIFGKIKNKMDPLGIMANKYNEAGLESVIKKYFKNSFLSETLTNVLVTSVNKNNNEMMIFDSRKAFRDPENDFFMRNVARATSAAPTFFAAAEFYNLTGTKFYSLIDGGVGKNDPTYFVFEGVKSIAENYGIPQKFSVISLGTGEIADQKVISQNAGVIEVKNLLNKCIDTHTELDQAIFKEKYGNVRYRRFQTVLKFGKNQDISLDNIDADLVKIYKDAASSIAEEFFIENYGEYQNISLIDWLAENTARKKELF